MEMSTEQLKRLTSFRKHLHRFPDLSGQEQATAERVGAYLSKCPPDHIATGLGGTGIAAVYEGAAPGPTVAIRCELDALPIPEETGLDHASEITGQGHLCGHDGHMVMVLALAEALSARRPARGRAVLLFQPAEETGKGAMALRADPGFQAISPDMVLSLHNLPGLALGHVLLNRGAANCASRGMKIRLLGKTSHASAPQDGVSPALAVSRLIPGMQALAQGAVLDADYALTTVTHAHLGEPTFGVAPGVAELWVTLRTVTDARMQALVSEARALVQSEAGREGLRAEISFDDIFEACANTPEAVAVLHRACTDGSIPITLTDTPQRFSEDFGQFSKTASAAMFWLGAGEGHPQLHNPDYDFPDALIPVGAGIFLRALRACLG